MRCSLPVDLVLAEALTNVISYGFPDGTDETIRVEAEAVSAANGAANPAGVLVRISDGGGVSHGS